MAMAGLAALLVLAIASRLIGLTEHPIWPDSGFTHTMTELPFSSLIMGHLDTHPGLYYVAAKVFSAFGEGEFWLRLLSVVCGVLSVVGMYLLAHHLSGRFAGLAAAALTASSGLLIYHSQRGRMYTLLFLLLVMAAYGYVLVLQRLASGGRHGEPARDRRDLLIGCVIYIVAAIAALYTHMVAAIFIASLCLTSLPFMVAALRRADHQALLCWIGANAILGLAWLPWLFGLGAVAGGQQMSWLPQPTVPEAAITLFNLYGAWVLPRVIDALLVALAMLGGLVLLMQRQWVALGASAAISAVFPAMVWGVGFIQPVFLERTVTPAMIGAFLLIAIALAHLRVRRTHAAVILALCVSVHLVATIKSRDWLPRQDWRFTASYMTARDDVQTAFVFDDVYSYHAFRFYADPPPDVVHYAWSEFYGHFFQFSDADFLDWHTRPPSTRLAPQQAQAAFPASIDRLLLARFYYGDAPPPEALADLARENWRIVSRQRIESRAVLEVVELARDPD